jgi:beta-lactamase regulating signal transducer with metallopeptidase domain
MTTTLLVTLALSVPLAVLAWIGALAVDRTSGGLKVRRAVWTLAFAAPLALSPMALVVRTLGWSAPPSPPLIHAASPAIAQVSASFASVAYDAPASAAETNWTGILLTLLAVVALLRLAALAWRALALGRIARAAAPLTGEFSGLTVRLYEGEAPMLVGLLKPVVLMPRSLASTFSPAEIALICAHERAHLRAGDHIANLLEAIAMAIFWFNPVLGPIRAGLSAVREEACDDAALTGAERPTRRAYAEVLLTAIRHAGGAEPAVAFTGFYRARSARRLRAILMPQGKGAKAAAAIAAGVGLILAGTAGGLAFAFAGSESAAALPAAPLPLAAEHAVSPAPVMAAPPAISPPPSTQIAALETPEPATLPRPAPAAVRARSGLADLDTMNALRKLLVDTRLQRIEIQARQTALDGIDPDDWPELRNNEDYKRLVSERNIRMERYKASVNKTFVGDPGLVDAREGIEKLDARIEHQRQLVRSDIRLELAMLDAKDVAIREQLASMSAAAFAADMAADTAARAARSGSALP